MNRLAKLSARFIGEQGFSIGIDDVTPAHELQVCYCTSMRTSNSCKAESLSVFLRLTRESFRILIDFKNQEEKQICA